ncbi:MAG: MarR family transcriptional regulator [Clostridia bacterium]|nr:MarR family transcriptional regulator [Clostridia bacterium]
MSDKAEFISLELKSLNRGIHRYLENLRCEKENLRTLSVTNCMIIGFLARNQGREIYQKDIEKKFGITRSTASKVIKLMEEKQLVRRQKVPGDARLRKLELTEKSLLISEVMAADAEKTEDQLLSGFSEDEKNTLAEYLERMKNNIGIPENRGKEETKP